MQNNSFMDTLQNDLDILHQRFDDAKVLRAEFSGFLDRLSYVSDSYVDVPSKNIWSCWFQGMDKAPDIVQSCYNTIKDNFDGYEKILITKDNLEFYTDIDPIVMQKWKDGIISNTAFSNIVRLELLINHGGLWLDSTIFCTDMVIPEFISKSPLFVYSNWKWISGDVRPISNWLMSACKDHVMLKVVRDLLVQYWHEKNELQTYFIFHMFFQMVIESFPEVWKQTPKISNLPPHMMQFELQGAYTAKRFEQLKTMSMFHKLTYKLPEKTITDDNNLYNYIIKNY